MSASGLLLAGGWALGIFLFATVAFVLTTRLIARRKGRIFLEGLGGVVRIGTPCRVVKGRALLPGTVALTPAGISWEAVSSDAGSLTFEEIQRLETDERLGSQRGFLRSKVLRVTPVSGPVREFVVSSGHAWEWRRALGEWSAAGGRLRA